MFEPSSLGNRKRGASGSSVKRGEGHQPTLPYVGEAVLQCDVWFQQEKVCEGNIHD